MSDPSHPPGLVKREENLEGTQVRLTIYEAAGRFHCKIDNIDPGTVIGRGHGTTADEAIEIARRHARRSLQLATARNSMRDVLARLTDAKDDRGKNE